MLATHPQPKNGINGTMAKLCGLAFPLLFCWHANQFAHGWSPSIPSSSQTQAQSESTSLCAVLATSEATKVEETNAGQVPSNVNPSLPPPAISRRALAVSSEIDLPFSAEIAFDAFADLNRQPEWSPWLHSVDYIEIDNDLSEFPATEWTLRVLGVSYSWISIATKQDRPYRVEWESVSGLKNFGNVHFEPLSNNRGCHMTMTMTFAPPRLVAVVFRNAQGIKHFMERKLIGSSLATFRDIIVQSTLDDLAPNTTMIFLPI